MTRTYDKEITNVKKGEIITCIEKDGFDDYKPFELKLRVDRVNKNTVSVTCISGYLKYSAWKIRK